MIWNTKVSARLVTTKAYTPTDAHTHERTFAHKRTQSIHMQSPPQKYIEILAWLYSSITSNIIHPYVFYVWFGRSRTATAFQLKWKRRRAWVCCNQLNFFFNFPLYSNLFTHNIVHISFRKRKRTTSLRDLERKVEKNKFKCFDVSYICKSQTIFFFCNLEQQKNVFVSIWLFFVEYYNLLVSRKCVRM